MKIPGRSEKSMRHYCSDDKPGLSPFEDTVSITDDYTSEAQGEQSYVHNSNWQIKSKNTNDSQQ